MIYEGMYTRQAVTGAFEQYTAGKNYPVEGFVVRTTDGFSYENFSRSVGKFVNHTFQINTGKHWKYDVKELNQLKDNQNVWEIIS